MCARPVKRGLEYFPLDVDMDSDTAVCVLEARHGIEGFGVLIKLFMRVYRSGYYIPWDERESIVFARRSGVTPETLTAIVETSLDEGLFHRGMFESHGILTSGGIQRRFVLAAKRRTGSTIASEYELLHTETPVNAAFSTQSKVKERKGKESKQERYAPNCFTPKSRDAFDAAVAVRFPKVTTDDLEAAVTSMTVRCAKGCNGLHACWRPHFDAKLAKARSVKGLIAFLADE